MSLQDPPQTTLANESGTHPHTQSLIHPDVELKTPGELDIQRSTAIPSTPNWQVHRNKHIGQHRRIRIVTPILPKHKPSSRDHHVAPSSSQPTSPSETRRQPLPIVQYHTSDSASVLSRDASAQPADVDSPVSIDYPTLSSAQIANRSAPAVQITQAKQVLTKPDRDRLTHKIRESRKRQAATMEKINSSFELLKSFGPSIREACESMTPVARLAFNAEEAARRPTSDVIKSTPEVQSARKHKAHSPGGNANGRSGVIATPTLHPVLGFDLTEPPIGPHITHQNGQPGSTHLDNNANRTLRTTFSTYRIARVEFVGFRGEVGDTWTPSLFGAWREADDFEVQLPRSLVAEVGAFWIGKKPTHDNFLVAQAWVRCLTRRIDFPTPELEEDCLLYGTYIGFVNRAHERSDLHARLLGKVYSRTIQRVALIAAAVPFLAGIPIAAAAPTAAIATTTFAAPLLAAATISAIAVACAAYCRGFGESKPTLVQHGSLASVNSTANPLPRHPDSTLKLLSNTKDAERVNLSAARFTGIAVKDCEPTIFAANLHNTVKALEKRSLAIPPPFDPKNRAEFIDWVFLNWDLLLGRHFKLDVPTDPDLWAAQAREWVEKCNSSTSVKKRYLRTIQDLYDQGITSSSTLTKEQLHEWTIRDCSVKTETILKTEEASPRQIMAAPPQFVVLVAPFISQLTGVIKRRWTKHNSHLVYAPGSSNKDLACRATAVPHDNKANGDFDGYDASQGEAFAHAEIRICAKYGAGQATKDLMRANIKVHGSSRCGVKFTAPYTRLSGDPFTTLFNTFWCLLSNLYVICTERGIRPNAFTGLILGGGDDFLTEYDGPVIDFTTRLALLGLPATVQHVDQYHYLEFLGCRLTISTSGWNFVPKVGRMVAKLACSVRARDLALCAPIAKGSAQSMIHSASACPPLRAYLQAILDKTSNVDAIRPTDEPWKMASGWTGLPTDDTWAQLYDVYGWTRELQTILEAQLKVAELGTVIESPQLKMLIDLDTSKKRPEFTRALSDDQPSEEKDPHNPPWTVSVPAYTPLTTYDDEADPEGFYDPPEVPTPDTPPPSPRPDTPRPSHVPPSFDEVETGLPYPGDQDTVYVHLPTFIELLLHSIGQFPTLATSSTWVPDLTAQGIEPNPGPASGTRVARNERALCAIAETIGMTDYGREWVTQAIDPFHDSPIQPRAIPNGARDPVAPQFIKQSFSLTCPAAITTGTWDVMILQLPWNKLVRLSTGAQLGGTDSNPTNDVYKPSTASSYTAGGMLSISVPTGTSFNPSTAAPSASNLYVPQVLPDSYFIGDTRVGTKGFEVHNTTSDLNRQGMVTVFATPIPSLDTSSVCFSQLNTAGSFSVNTPVNVLQIPSWPSSLAAAVLTPGARQWTAEQGAYVVPRLCTTDVSVDTNGSFIMPFINGGDSSSTSLNSFPITANSNINSANPVYPAVFWDNFEMAGALFTGLSLQTTLTVNWNVCVERYPDPTITDLIVLCSPPPERDEVALKLYTHLAAHMPVGVPVAENGFGDWFADALSTAADFISPVLSALPGPIGALGLAVSGINAASKRGQNVKAQLQQSVAQAYQTNPYVDPMIGSTQQQRVLTALNESRIPRPPRSMSAANGSAVAQENRDIALVRAATRPTRQALAMSRIRASGQRRRSAATTRMS